MGTVVLDLDDYNKLRDENTELKSQFLTINNNLNEKSKFIDEFKAYIFEQELDEYNIKHFSKEECLDAKEYGFAFNKNGFSYKYFSIEDIVNFINEKWDEAHKEKKR